jgi:integrase
MTAYRPKGKTVSTIKVPLADGVWVSRSTRSRDPNTVKQMQAMVDRMGPFDKRAFDILAKCADPTAPGYWSLTTLYGHYVTHKGDLEALRRELKDERLADLFEPFLKHVAAQRSEDTVNHYSVYLNTLEAADITRLSHLTPGALEAWLDGLADPNEQTGKTLSTGTRRKYAAGVSAFCAWLARKGKLQTNVMRDVPKPARGARRVRWIPESEMIRLVNAMRSPFRELSALIHGTSLDVSAALALPAGAIDTVTWGIHHVRPKSQNAHTLLVADWARPYVRALVKGKLPLAPVGGEVSRWALSDEHRDACVALQIPNYWLRDARHSWAVRFGKLGGTPAQGAEQLGHSDGGVLYLSLYAQFIQPLSERQAIEDAARERGA